VFVKVGGHTSRLSSYLSLGQIYRFDHIDQLGLWD
jgi:hypothetical protein